MPALSSKEQLARAAAECKGELLIIVEHVPMKELVSLKEVRLDDGEEEKILLEKGGTAAKGAVSDAYLHQSVGSMYIFRKHAPQLVEIYPFDSGKRRCEEFTEETA